MTCNYRSGIFACGADNRFRSGNTHSELGWTSGPVENTNMFTSLFGSLFTGLIPLLIQLILSVFTGGLFQTV